MKKEDIEALKKAYPGDAYYYVGRPARRLFKEGFKAGAEWMAGQGVTLECLIDYKSGALIGIDSMLTQEMLKDYCNKIGASRVIVQIRKKED